MQLKLLEALYMEIFADFVVIDSQIEKILSLKYLDLHILGMFANPHTKFF